MYPSPPVLTSVSGNVYQYPLLFRISTCILPGKDVIVDRRIAISAGVKRPVDVVNAA